jgi:hypothetical protein
MEVKKFIGKVLSDGHLSLPEDTAKNVGKIFEVTPLEEAAIYPFAETLAREKGLATLTEKDIEKIIHESRGIR